MAPGAVAKSTSYSYLGNGSLATGTYTSTSSTGSSTLGKRAQLVDNQ